MAFRRNDLQRFRSDDFCSLSGGAAVIAERRSAEALLPRTRVLFAWTGRLFDRGLSGPHGGARRGPECRDQADFQQLNHERRLFGSTRFTMTRKEIAAVAMTKAAGERSSPLSRIV